MARSPLVVTALSACALAACAGGPGGPRGGPQEQGAAYRQSTFLSGAALLFVQFDADKDYRTSRAEAEAGARSEWARAAHGPAGMTPIQFEAWAAAALGGPNIGPYRLAFDTNVNNEVTEPEFIAGILARFDRYDGDKDGVVTRAEMVERLPDPRPGPGTGGPDGRPDGRDRPPGGGQPR